MGLVIMLAYVPLQILPYPIKPIFKSIWSWGIVSILDDQLCPQQGYRNFSLDLPCGIKDVHGGIFLASFDLERL